MYAVRLSHPLNVVVGKEVLAGFMWVLLLLLSPELFKGLFKSYGELLL